MCVYVAYRACAMNLIGIERFYFPNVGRCGSEVAPLLLRAKRHWADSNEGWQLAAWMGRELYWRWFRCSNGQSFNLNRVVMIYTVLLRYLIFWICTITINRRYDTLKKSRLIGEYNTFTILHESLYFGHICML